MKTVAVIPARGGSVGLPGKNIKPLDGVPLVGRSARAALGSRHVDAVYVSSDDETILAVGEQYGAGAIRRPAAISGSTASSESALIHALDEIAARDGEADILVFLQCTSPFTTSADIDAVIDAMLAHQADAAFSAVEDHGFIWQIGADGTAEGITHDHRLPRQRRQDMTPRYRENGAIYAMRVSAFRTIGNRFCGKTVLVPIDAPAIEIDTPEDWAIAEAWAAAHRKAGAASGPFKALVTDFDGVHTDDHVTVHQDGSESVRCSRSDGMGIEILRKAGMKLLILSKETNPVVQARAAKLKMQVKGSIEAKFAELDAWRIAEGLEWAEIVYVGNDINDLDCLRAAGLGCVPADAHPEARKVAGKVLSANGGSGALREVSDYLVSQGLIG